MSETTSCPYCGLPQPTRTASGALAPLYHEVRRIREIAQARADAEQRAAALAREVDELRATVARLRGSGAREARAAQPGAPQPGTPQRAAAHPGARLARAAEGAA